MALRAQLVEQGEATEREKEREKLTGAHVSALPQDSRPAPQTHTDRQKK